MNIISRLFGRSATGTAPWTEESIYRLISAHVDSKSGALDSSDLALPDEPPKSGSELRWAPGALDGVMGHHGAPEEDSGVARTIAKALDTVARTGNVRMGAEAYAMLKEESVLSSIDAVIKLLGQWDSPAQPHLSEFAVRLATKSADRGPVKAGIALLGALRRAEHEAVVTTLGLHEEFTLFSAMALRNMLEDPTPALWRLAQRVHGWGRIQIVERLVPADNEEIRRWLRTDGFRNSVMNEYLALTAAVHGNLRAALDQDNLGSEELVAAGEIILFMIAAELGPGGGLDQYADAAMACLAYLKHVQSAPPDLRNLLASHAILEYVAEDRRSDAERLKCGWNESIGNAARACATQVIEGPAWRVLIERQLDSDEREIFGIANRAAKECGIDAFEWHWRRVQAVPRDPGRWYDVMQTVNAERIDQVIMLAEERLPLDGIATGPADELGLGKEFEPHSCLDFVLQDLRRFPGKGSRLILAGLRSPVVRNRNMAIAALKTWDRCIWTPDTLPALRRAADEETVADVAGRICALISG